MPQRLLPAPALLAWFDSHARALPWRGPNIPAWHILISEVMLQQTPVSRVLDPYQVWVRRWPTPAALATDSPGQAVRAWGRLGYPRRALRLHGSAVAICARHDGLVPTDLQALLALPGVGEYTARAVAAFAFGQRTAVVDTNVHRVLARAVRGTDSQGPVRAADRDELAALLPHHQAPTFCAALMELGALICTSVNPDCVQCPLRAGCAWRAAGYTPSVRRRRAQPWHGTDRQLRGRIMELLRQRENPASVAELRTALAIDAALTAQFDRCITGLRSDGLLVGVDPLALPH